MVVKRCFLTWSCRLSSWMRWAQSWALKTAVGNQLGSEKNRGRAKNPTTWDEPFDFPSQQSAAWSKRMKNTPTREHDEHIGHRKM
jgi:hypothetical protein